MQDVKPNPTNRWLIPGALAVAGGAAVFLSLAAGRIGLRTENAAFGTNQLALMLGGLLLAFSAAAVALGGAGRSAATRLTVAAGAVGVVVAADLFLVRGLAEPTYKAFLLSSLAAAFVILKTSAVLKPGERFRDALQTAWAKELNRLPELILLVLQLGLIVLAFRAFRIENQVFYGSITLIVLFGFIFNVLLPAEERLPFFLFLSIATIAGVVGLLNGLWLVIVVLAMVGVMHLPAPFWVRAALALLAGGFLAYARAGYLALLPAAIWPILGSILMFRLIIYAYDLKHSKKPFNPWQTLAYFFLLPNIMFPFFPVVDHGVFMRTYYNQEDHLKIYRSGVTWIMRGLLHLIGYRLVYYYLVIPPAAVVDGFTWVRFVFTTFLLYLQISGHFHIITGILHLFGFNLPLTNDNYLLAKNFTDLWRRNNIYWKDFMQKIFYYPSSMWLSKRGIRGAPALVLTTIWVFFATWFLHAYYWFWIRGDFLISATDIIFWSILGVLVLVNILREAKRGRDRSLGSTAPGLREIVVDSLRNAGTLSVLTVIWSLWTSPTIADWFNLLRTAFAPRNLPELLVGYAGIVLLFILLNLFWRQIIEARKPAWEAAPVRATLAATGLAALILLAGQPEVYRAIGGRAETFLADVTTPRLNEADADLLLRGYYENLTGVNRFNTELWELYSKRPTDWPLLQETPAARLTDDFRLIELIPNTTIQFHGAQFSVNEWGFRDGEYALVPEAGTFRTVLIGPSFVMGSGVGDGEVFEALLESRLNTTLAGGVHERYEILNFGVAGFSALQELYVLEQGGLRFEPDALIFVGHQIERSVMLRNLANRIKVGSEIPYPFLQDLIGRAGIDASLSEAAIEAKLEPFSGELLAWTYAQIVRTCEENGILPIWVYLEALEVPATDEERVVLTGAAEEAGFITLDLSGIYIGQDIPSITVAEWDLHPNQIGHRLIAEALFTAMAANPAIAAAFGMAP